VTVEVDLEHLASYDGTKTNADGTTGSFVFELGTYWFAFGNGAHDALNAVLAASGVDAGRLAGSADASHAWRLDVTDAVLPADAFSVSKTGVAVSNHLDYADWNHF
jgi:beta-glucosidase